MRKLWKLMVHGVWIGSWVLVIVAALSLGDDSPHSTYDETGNEVTSSRLVLAPDRPECAKATTLTFCLDDARYPSDDIQREISTNYGVFYKMYAEVSNQTTSSLVDGVAVDEEATYDYAFYYGDKMNLPTKSAARNSPAYKNYAYKNDYFKDGGYICPAFINYGSIYQAMNARGEWQYIVNLKPWTQTVRLEQCFYPHAPCSYMSTSFETRCVQKYSFQRLIAFEPQGYAFFFPLTLKPHSYACKQIPILFCFNLDVACTPTFSACPPPVAVTSAHRSHKTPYLPCCKATLHKVWPMSTPPAATRSLTDISLSEYAIPHPMVRNRQERTMAKLRLPAPSTEDHRTGRLHNVDHQEKPGLLMLEHQFPMLMTRIHGWLNVGVFDRKDYPFRT
ncbi:hypothetical protein RvY_11160-2 [Ramazzottius varieornatus]|uniref:Spaetzle domain-containing protein n=1 Tax=Ramazzottius varieornatus TaxID=947166 RepID=A0A1D1VF68_RAMVA|nr:hypothetical protein RvY_11160-2 [Ramazzottius varieornatus]